VEDILNKGFGIETRDAHGNTPLMVAAQNGHKRLCKLTLKFGAEPNAGNHQGNTSLHFATGMLMPASLCWPF
jgi:ankyrin repeat protein